MEVALYTLGALVLSLIGALGNSLYGYVVGKEKEGSRDNDVMLIGIAVGMSFGLAALALAFLAGRASL